MPTPTMLDTPAQAALWLRCRVKGHLHTDSRKVRTGDGFIAWPGAAADGRQYVGAALQSGASACLVEKAGAEHFSFDHEAIAAYRQLKAATGPIAAAYFEQPTRHLDVIAVTGTNGKTSTAWWLAHSLSNLKHESKVRCGLVGTLGIGRFQKGHAKEGPEFEVTDTGMTTPDPVLLQQTFREFVDRGMQACVIEASSIGIEERRLDGTRIRTAIFTNFTQDHLDYHGTMQAYWDAKASLFQWPGLQAAVINVDDAKGFELAATLGAAEGIDHDTKPLDIWTTSCRGPARLQAVDIRYVETGLHFTVLEGLERHVLFTQLIGQYNVENLLGVIGAMRTLGVPLAVCVDSCRTLQPVPGRMECQGGSGQPLVAVDYAHTPDALSQALRALRQLAAQRGGELWCVFGCGGDRDALKRPVMGEMAARHADRVVVTSDNPRSESPQAIADQILPGLAGHSFVKVQLDRALAIGQTLAQAGAADVILVAGKGHENYQEIAGARQAFSDQVQVKLALRQWTSQHAAQGAIT